MFWVKIAVVLCVGVAVYSQDKKWVWNDNARSLKEGDRESKLSRYEIFEDQDNDYGSFPGSALGGGDYNRPGLHGPPGPRPFPGQRPLSRPESLYPGQVANYPGGAVGIGNFRPVDPGYGASGPDRDVLVGPDLDGGRPFLKKFDTCTCSERFNCKSPGISYGHCDVGKSYCCFNKHGGLEIEPAPSKPIHSPENGILVGPGHGSGGYGRPNHQGRPPYGGGLGYRPPIRDQGVLVGPGGPSGIIGRPIGAFGGRPMHSSGNGVLVGPGGPYDRPYANYGNYGRPGIYGRSLGGGESKKE